MKRGIEKGYLKRAAALLLAIVVTLGCIPVTQAADESLGDVAMTTGTDITAIERPSTKALIINYDQWVVNVETSLRLPTTVTVTLANGETAEASVSWDTTGLKYDEVGTYILNGTITLPEGATNGAGLTVTQKIIVREYQNLLADPDFENGVSDWGLVAGPVLTQVSSPVKEGSYAIQSTITKKAQRANYISQNVTDALNSNGPGEYYISSWGQLGEEATAEALDRYWTRLDILADGNTTSSDWKYVGTSYISDRTFSPAADTADGNKAPVSNQSVTLVAGTWAQSHRRVMLNFETINQARIEVGVTGGSSFVSNIYVDNAELVPLNVTLPASSEPIEYDDNIAEVSLLQTKAIIQNYDQWVVDVNASLRLPATVDVLTEKGQTVAVGVTWNTESLKYETLGTYNLVGTLQAAEAGLNNSNNMTATQTVIVRAYQNLLINPGFEDGASDWGLMAGPTHTQVTAPTKEGSYAIQSVISSRSQRANYISQSITDILNATGAGEYYISSWGQLGEGATAEDADIYWTRLDIKADGSDWKYVGTSYISDRTLSPAADTADSSKAPVSNQSVALVADTWVQSHRRVMLNFDSINQARIEVGITGGSSGFVSMVYIDDMELVPLNVTLPAINDIVSYTAQADIRVYEGTNFNALGLPESVKVLLRNGNVQTVPVTWTESTYSNQVGTHTITGAFNLTGLTVTNTRKLFPSIKVIVRENGADLRDTYYFSTSGSDENDGLSENTPLKDVTQIPELLKSGANVLLKRGDIWYVPEFSLNVDGVKGTSESDRITLGAYGDTSDPKPVLAFMYKRTASEWSNEGNNVYSADISDLVAVNSNGVIRVFVDGVVYSMSTLIWECRNADTPTLTAIDDPANLEAEEFCVKDNKVYIKTNGQSFNNVELVPWGTSYGHRLTGTDVSYLTIENLDLRGGSTLWAFAWFGAPSYGLLIQNTDFLYVNNYVIQFSMTGVTPWTHMNPTIRGCTLDGKASVKEGADFRIIHGWQSIEMREAVDGALIENNTFRNVGHAAVELSMPGSNANEEMSAVVAGVKNCIIQNNLIEGVNSGYARAFTITGHTNEGSESDMVHDNVFRWNQCYGMTTSSHLLGENNVVYGNIFAFTNIRYTGWTGQPYAIDTVLWDIENGKHVSRNNVVLNNTIYGAIAGIAIAGSGENVTDNLYANNLFVNHKNSNMTYIGGIGVNWEGAEGALYILNNGFYTNWSTNKTAISWDGKQYSTSDANLYIDNAEDNIEQTPGFANVDALVMERFEKCFDFSLTDTSAYRYTGIDVNNLDSELLAKFPALNKLDSADETGIQLKDLSNNYFLSGTPSIGAISHTRILTGKVTSIAAAEPKIVKTGTDFAELGLPKTVEVTLEDGATAMLAVTWDGDTYNALQTGEQTITGALSKGVHTDLDLNNMAVSCEVTIKDKLEIQELLTISGVTVANGTEVANVGLPTTCQAVLEDGTLVSLDLVWTAPDNYEATTEGTYQFTGIPTLTQDTLNTQNLKYTVSVIVQKELQKGDELLINPDFIENGTYDPWVMGWDATQGIMEVTTDPTLVKEGEPAAMIVTAYTKYSGIQQDVTAQVKTFGNGKYLFELWIRALKEEEPILTSQVDLQVQSDYLGSAVTNIGAEYVRVREIFNVTTVDEATKVLFHTSTLKDKDDAYKSFLISGCSLIYLGANDNEANTTLDKMELTWGAIKGENVAQNAVTSNLSLPTLGTNGSVITWTSSDNSVLTSDGTIVVQQDVESSTNAVTLTANIQGVGYSDTVTFDLTVVSTAEESAEG